MTFYVIDSSNSINDTVASTTALTINAGDNVIVKSTGSVLATGSNSSGIFVSGSASNGTVQIDGLVYGTEYGIYSLGSGTRITVNGTVTSGDQGIHVNNGDVYVSRSGIVSGDFEGIGLSTGSGLINDGTVNGGGNWAVEMSWGSITNNGLISSRSTAIFYGGEQRSSVRNTGTIQGDLDTFFNATATAELNVLNSGLWFGNLHLAPGNDYLTNTGTIDGEINLQDGDNQLDSRYGLILGNVLAGSGNDWIRLGEGDTGIVGGGGGDIIDGGAGFDTVSYSSSTAGVSINLLTGTAFGGDATGDRLSNIEGIDGTLRRDTLIGDDGANVLNGLTGKDTLTGNGGNDTIQMVGAGPSVIDGGAGNDLIQLQSADVATYGYAFTTRSKVNGGSGYDTLEIMNAPTMTLSSTVMKGIEQLLVDDGFDYNLTSVDATVVAGGRLLVGGALLTIGNSLRFDGSRETNGAFDFIGGAGIDTFIGGSLDDTFEGGRNRDVLTGGAGTDTFIFSGQADSDFGHRDRITDFVAGTDKLLFDVDVTGVNAKVTGSAGTSADLTALASGHLTANHAIVVAITGGSLSGSTFLLVDANGAAGFQGGTDYCIDVTGMTGTLTIGDFIL